MANDSKQLIAELRRAGFSTAAIQAAWPSWWTEEADASPSGRAELRFALARRLGLEPKPLLGERVEFVWNDEARFKHLSVEDGTTRAALTSFGVSVGRLLLQAVPRVSLASASAEQLRNAILTNQPFVDLTSLVATCWGLGVPVIHLRVLPLEAKSMHAMVVGVDGRFAVLLARDASYPAPVAFTLAHELGHVLCGHLAGAPALVDVEDPAFALERDEQEMEADCFALTLLTGSSNPDIQTNVEEFNAPTLAGAVLKASAEYGVEPGTLALCLAYRRKNWPVAMSALRFIYSQPRPIWQHINGIANSQLDWSALSEEGADYLQNVMGGTSI
ncbi:MAG: ImmA/IrrE family metallo-endopeptidase [Phenylobacterium sp.]|uniref:ImmA/IrrE family metallo-endopeptidase n=1 Tax=Phenylobacterium sp. TaxID=1871053 RepID=UPI00391BF3D0